MCMCVCVARLYGYVFHSLTHDKSIESALHKSLTTAASVIAIYNEKQIIQANRCLIIM